MKINQRLIIKIELLVLSIILAAGLFKFVNIPPSLKEAVVLATTVKPETFTELYFEDHNSLPKTLETYKEFGFVFTTHNLENKDVEYSYVVYLERESLKIVLDQGSFSLKNNEFKSIKEYFGFSENIRTKIVVELLNKKQIISLWMENQ